MPAANEYAVDQASGPDGWLYMEQGYGAEVYGDLARFILPLPPVSKNASSRLRRQTGLPAKVSTLKQWERGIKLLLRGWTPPRAKPLQVQIKLYYPKGKLHRWGIDGRLSALLDTVLGVRGDEWADALTIRKRESADGEGYAVVSVAEMDD
jgi:hypothetical protein